MALFKIPFSNLPQKFSIDFVGRSYILVNRWNPVAECWYIDVYDSNDNPIVMNLPLVTGCDLFEQFEHLGFGAQMIVYVDGDETQIPTLDNLGTEANVWLVT